MKPGNRPVTPVIREFLEILAWQGAFPLLVPWMRQ